MEDLAENFTYDLEINDKVSAVHFKKAWSLQEL